MTCTSCHNPHGDGHAGAPQGELDQRDVLHLPRREARALPLGARPGRRELRELSRPPRLEPREDAEGREAAALPAVPRRDAAPHAALRPRPALAEVRAGTVVRELPRQHPRLEPSVRLRLHAIGGRRDASTAGATMVVAAVLAPARGPGVAGPAAAQMPARRAERSRARSRSAVRFFVDEPPTKPTGASSRSTATSPSSSVLEDLRLRLFTPDESYSVELGGIEVGPAGPGVLAARRAARALGVRLRLGPDPARLLDECAARSRPRRRRGVFTLPTPRPTCSTPTTRRVSSTRSASGGTRRGSSSTLTPTPDLDLKRRVHADQARTASGRSAWPSAARAATSIEVLEPIDADDPRLPDAAAPGRASAGRSRAATRPVDLQERPEARRRQPVLRPRRPRRPAAPATPRERRPPAVSLAPDNMAHTLSVAGGVNLPMRTRSPRNVCTASGSRTSTFLAHTINPALASTAPRAAPAEPRRHGRDLPAQPEGYHPAAARR